MITISMAYSRQQFFKRVRDDLLSGAFREFMCREISLIIDKPDYWTNEVHRLLKKVKLFMNKDLTKTTFSDTDKALIEAFGEMYHAYGRINAAKSKLLDYPGYGVFYRDIMELDLDTEQYFKKMINEFLPEFSHLLP
jgi:hypothetical protein